MAKLVILTEGFGNQIIDLKLGVNRLGRAAGNDFQIEHPAVSGRHCEILLGNGELRVRDCSSTNGTFIGNQPVTEASLASGQVLRLGAVELFVESTEVNVAIPEYDKPCPAPPIVLSDGGLVCPRHPDVRASHQCTHCREVMCDACVHRLRRRGGRTLKLCPLCSQRVASLGGAKAKKKSLMSFLQRTVKLPFTRASRERDERDSD